MQEKTPSCIFFAIKMKVFVKKVLQLAYICAIIKFVIIYLEVQK